MLYIAMQFSVKLYWITLTKTYNFLKNTTGFDLACCFASVKEVFNFFFELVLYTVCGDAILLYVVCVTYVRAVIRGPEVYLQVWN